MSGLAGEGSVRGILMSVRTYNSTDGGGEQEEQGDANGPEEVVGGGERGTAAETLCPGACAITMRPQDATMVSLELCGGASGRSGFGRKQ